MTCLLWFLSDAVATALQGGGAAAAAAGPGYRFVFYVRQQGSAEAAEDSEEDTEDVPPKRVAVTLPPPVRGAGAQTWMFGDGMRTASISLSPTDFSFCSNTDTEHAARFDRRANRRLRATSCHRQHPGRSPSCWMHAAWKATSLEALQPLLLCTARLSSCQVCVCACFLVPSVTCR